MILDIINNSKDKDSLSMSQEVGDKTEKLRQFMFDNVYLNSSAKTEDDKAEYIISELYKYYLTNLDKLPLEYQDYDYMGSSHEDRICDYIAGMTDRYVRKLFTNIFLPKSWEKF